MLEVTCIIIVCIVISFHMSLKFTAFIMVNLLVINNFLGKEEVIICFFILLFVLNHLRKH